MSGKKPQVPPVMPEIIAKVVEALQSRYGTGNVSAAEVAEELRRHGIDAWAESERVRYVIPAADTSPPPDTAPPRDE